MALTWNTGWPKGDGGFITNEALNEMKDNIDALAALGGGSPEWEYINKKVVPLTTSSIKASITSTDLGELFDNANYDYKVVVDIYDGNTDGAYWYDNISSMYMRLDDDDFYKAYNYTNNVNDTTGNIAAYERYKSEISLGITTLGSSSYYAMNIKGEIVITRSRNTELAGTYTYQNEFQVSHYAYRKDASGVTSPAMETQHATGSGMYIRGNANLTSIDLYHKLDHTAVDGDIVFSIYKRSK